MHHGVAYLDSGRKTIGQDASRLALQHGDEALRVGIVCGIDLQRHCQLALQLLSQLENLIEVFGPNDNRGRAKHLLLQHRR